MSNLQVKNVPDELYARLRDYADESNSTISAIVLSAVERELDKANMVKRLAGRSSVEISTSAAEILREERALREEATEHYLSGGADQDGGEPLDGSAQ